MLFLDLFFLMALFWLTIPLVSGYYAYTHGRSFWFWFFMGVFLPVISHFILVFLPDKTDYFEQELEELRLMQGVAGIKKEEKLLAKLPAHRHRVAFAIKELANQEKTLEIWIDHLNLQTWIEQLCPKVGERQWQGIPLALIKPTSLHLLGEPQPYYGDKANRAALLEHTQGTPLLMANIYLLRKYVVWTNFRHSQKPAANTEKLIFVFHKLQYIEALSHLQNQWIDIAKD